MAPPRRTRARQKRRKPVRLSYLSPLPADGLAASAPASSSTSSRQTLASRNRLSTTKLTKLPADIIDRILLHLLDAPHLSRTLSGRSFDNFDHIAALATTHPVFRVALSHLVHSLCLHWNDTIAPHELALFTASLRHLSINRHSLTTHYLRALSDRPPPLRSLRLDSVDLPENALCALIVPNRLHALSLAFVSAPDLPAALAGAAHALSDLADLELHGLSDLSAATLLLIARAAGPSLRALSLRYLRHPSLRGAALARLPAFCPGVTSLALEDVRHAPPAATLALARAYAPALAQLHLHATGAPLPDLHGLLRAMPHLRRVSLHDPGWRGAPSLDPLADGLARAVDLRALDLRAVPRLRDNDVIALLAGAPYLEELSLRRLPGITLRTWRAVAALEYLRKLDLRGSYVCDEALHVLASARATGAERLNSLALGGDDGHTLTPIDAAVVAKRTVSNPGLDVLLWACGNALEEFIWETPRTIVGTPRQRVLIPVGVAKLHAKELAECLAERCPMLKRVEVNWLRPVQALEKERAICDLAFLKLDEKCRHAVVVVDREPI